MVISKSKAVTSIAFIESTKLMLRQVINIDESACYHAVSTNKVYGLACCIAVFIIKVNDTSCYIDVFINKGCCLQNHHACRAGNDLRQACAIGHQQNQLLHQLNEQGHQQNI